MERREDVQSGEREIKYPTGEAGWKVLDEKWGREEERRIERETLTLIHNGWLFGGLLNNKEV